jgi:hypothetical protein
MELKFTELDNNEDNTTLTEQTSYWNKTNQPVINPKKKQVSYDDILSSLSMVVHNGILQFAPNQKIINSQQQSQQQSQEPSKKVQFQQQPKIQPKPQNQIQSQIQPQGKNYIINKYFNDYKDPNIIEEPQRPLTKEEYKQMMIQNYVKRIEEKKRIAQIKPKKLLFNTNNIHISPNQNPKEMNKLFAPFKR